MPSVDISPICWGETELFVTKYEPFSFEGAAAEVIDLVPSYPRDSFSDTALQAPSGGRRTSSCSLIFETMEDYRSMEADCRNHEIREVTEYDETIVNAIILNISKPNFVYYNLIEADVTFIEVEVEEEEEEEV